MFSIREKLEKKRKIKFFVFFSLFLVSLVVCGFCLFKIFQNKQQSDKADNEYQTLTTIKEHGEQEIDQNKNHQIPKFHKDLCDKNNDYVGWIEIPGTRINYPVVQAEDNQKYLKQTFEGEKSEVGAIFVDVCCNDDFTSPNTVIHGHSRLDKSMFGQLHSYNSDNFKKEHSKIIIKTKEGKELVYKIFHSAVANKDAEVYSTRGDEEKSQTYVDSLGLGKNRKILTLSTCVSSSEGCPDRKIVQAVLEQ